MNLSMKSFLAGVLIALTISTGFPLNALADTDGDKVGSSMNQQATAEAAASADQADPNRVSREGVVVEFSVSPTSGDSKKVVAVDWADVTFRITDEGTGEPIKGRYPAAWMDLGEAWEALGDNDRAQEQYRDIIASRASRSWRPARY